MTLGIVGLGNIGGTVARIALDFGMDVFALTGKDPTSLPEGIRKTTLDGLLAVAKPKYKILSEFKPKKDALIIVLETVEKPGNLGAVMRTADAAGVDAVIIADPATDIFNPNAIRASIGCIFSVPVYTCSTEECINWLKQNGITIYCTYLKASIDYLDADFRKATALVMGTEATGISDAWVGAADQNIIIPMNGIADSLNVSVTTAIVTFEAVRQRRTK